MGSEGRCLTMALVVSAQEGEFEDVLCYSGWWDCPRSGVAVIDGKPHFFDCRFSEELDDYPVLYDVWPAGDQELADALEAFREFAAWRDLWDSGKHPSALGRSEARAGEQRRLEKGPPQAARTAVPEWHLDRNRSFAGRRPNHKVRWTFS
jgi:hypothetical protein